MDRLALAPADGVGVYVSATSRGSLLCVCLSHGIRGQHRVVVYDTTRAFQIIAAYDVPNRSASGSTPIVAMEDDLLVTADSRSLTAVRLRSGALVWDRAFSDPVSLRGADPESGLLLLVDQPPKSGALVVRAADGSTVRELPYLMSAFACGVGADASIVTSTVREIHIAHATGEVINVPVASAIVDVLCFDEAGTHVVVGTREGDLVIIDISTRTSRTIAKMPKTIRTVGTLAEPDAVWALDRDGHLRIYAMPQGSVELTTDLAIDNMGGHLHQGRAYVALADDQTRRLHVRALPSGEEIFTSTPGFRAQAVAVAGDCALVIAGPSAVVRIDPDTCAVKKLRAGAHVLRALPSGEVLAGSMSEVALLPIGGDKPIRLGRATSGFEVSPDGTQVVLLDELVVRVVSMALRQEIAKWDFRKTALAEIGEVIDAAFFAPDGDVLLRISNGDVVSASRLRAKAEGALHRFPTAEAPLITARDGASLFRLSDRAIERWQIGSWSREIVAHTPIDSAMVHAAQSPSGRHLVLFHRNGRFAVLDLAQRTAIEIATPATSAGERDPKAIYSLDLETPNACAFTADERCVIVVAPGQLVFADVATGAVVGALIVTTNGRSCVVTDGDQLSWSGTGKRGERPAKEILISSGGQAIDDETIASHRRPGVLRSLMRGARA